MSLTLRPGTPADAERCGTICYEAFKAIADRHHFPPDFPSPQANRASVPRGAAAPSMSPLVAWRTAYPGTGKVRGGPCIATSCSRTSNRSFAYKDRERV